MTIRTYSSAEAFKQALEQRLRTITNTGAAFARKRQLLVFDRFLARVVAVLGETATLKGGLVLEIRLERARATKDIDLRVMGSPEEALAKLQEIARRDLGDFMTFEISPDEEQPEIQNDGMQYDGLRFRAECKLAGKLYGQRFGVDVAFGDPILGEPPSSAKNNTLSLPRSMWRSSSTRTSKATTSRSSGALFFAAFVQPTARRLNSAMNASVP